MQPLLKNNVSELGQVVQLLGSTFYGRRLWRNPHFYGVAAGTKEVLSAELSRVAEECSVALKKLNVLAPTEEGGS